MKLLRPDSRCRTALIILCYRRTSLNPSGSSPFAPYASLTSASGPSAPTASPFPFPLAGLAATTSVASARPFFNVSVPLPSPTSRSPRTSLGSASITSVVLCRHLDRVLLAGESSAEGGKFSLSIFDLAGVTRPRLAGVRVLPWTGEGGEEKISSWRLDGAVLGGGAGCRRDVEVEVGWGFGLTEGVGVGLSFSSCPFSGLTVEDDDDGKPLMTFGWIEERAFRVP